MACLQGDEFPGTVPFGHAGEDKALLFAGLAEVDALDGAGIDDGGMAPVVQALVFVNVAESYIVPTFVADQAAAEGKFVAEHDGALAAVTGPGDAGVGEQDEGQVGIGFLQEQGNAVHHAGFQNLEHFVCGLAGHFGARKHAATRNPGDGNDLHGKAKGIRLQPDDPIGHDVQVGYVECLVFLKRVSAAGGRGDVVIAYEEHGWDACLGKAHHAPPPLALEGGLGVAIFVSIAGEEDEIHLFFDGAVDDLV